VVEVAEVSVMSSDNKFEPLGNGDGIARVFNIVVGEPCCLVDTVYVGFDDVVIICVKSDGLTNCDNSIVCDVTGIVDVLVGDKSLVLMIVASVNVSRVVNMSRVLVIAGLTGSEDSTIV